jgi:hypothetical protein
MKKSILLLLFALHLMQVFAQRNPIEIIVGDKRTSADVTFAKTLDTKGKWVFFNRSRYHVYHDETMSKPSFGTSLGVLYQLKGGLYAGFLASANSNEGVLRTGFYGRYAKGNFSIRSVIATVELRQNPSLDAWAIVAFTPTLNKQTKLFTQVEIAGRNHLKNGI